jgi:hypothetical protein
MAKIWFRRRTGLRGVGYSVASLEGLIAMVVFICLTTATVHFGMTGARAANLDHVRAALVVGVPLLVELGLFLWLVVQKSDRPQDEGR